MPGRDPLIDSDHHIRLDAVLKQRPIGRIDADKQRTLRLRANSPKPLEVLLQARSGGDDKDFPTKLSGKS